MTVQLIPFTSGGHHGIVSPFTVISFAKAPTVVFLEHLRSSVFLDEHPDTVPYQSAIQSLARKALGPAESANLIAAIAAEYERE